MKKKPLDRIETPNFLSPVRIGFLYLLIPFLAFSLGFIKLVYSIPMVLLLIWVTKKYWINSKEDSEFSFESKKDLLIGAGILFLLVVLSGIGGFAFQNPDFHVRNAIFRDLVTMKWPVIYSHVGQPASSSYGFTYYLGYWLPSALFGKLLGWKAANFVLFIWTLIGVHIAACLLMKKTKLSFIKSTLLLIFFSGMDFAGVLATRSIHSNIYPNIWPPIQHLEWWAPGMQFSSFTTQFFWVFNQAIPAWISVLITINLNSKKAIFLIFALCFFLSPISATGLLVITMLVTLTYGNRQDRLNNYIKKIGLNRFSKIVLREIREIITIENVLGGGLILITSLIFFYSSSSDMPRKISAIKIENLFIFIFFSLFEWLILWLAISNQYKKKPLFYLVGVFLLVAPSIRLSGSDVIAKRATTPMLLMLLVWCSDYLRLEKGRRRVIVIILLLLGSLTPIFEINRSIYQTSIYYLQNRESSPATQSLYLSNSNKPRFPSQPESDHPGKLIADEWYTLSVFNPESMGNWIGSTSNSFFYRYIAKQ